MVYDNLNAGIMLHRSSDNAIVRNNTISGNGDSCVAIFESMGEREKERNNGRVRGLGEFRKDIVARAKSS